MKFKYFILVIFLLLVSACSNSYDLIDYNESNNDGNTSIDYNESNNNETVESFELFPISSSRGNIGTGNNVLIHSIHILGNESQLVLINGIGPSLKGDLSKISNPKLRLFDSNGEIAFNDNWEDSNNLDLIKNSNRVPNSTYESSILIELEPGAYTVHLEKDSNEASGIGLIQIFSNSSNIYFDDLNIVPYISSRANIGNFQDVLIQGIHILENTSQFVLINGIGPSLKGDLSKISNPKLRLFDSNGEIAFNDNWLDSIHFNLIKNTGKAPNSSYESSILIELEPGIYTVHLEKDSNEQMGIAQIRLFYIDDLGEYNKTEDSFEFFPISSSRGNVGDSNEVLIQGFNILSNESQLILINGIGPSLEGINNKISNPKLRLFGPNGEIAFNDNWLDSENYVSIKNSGRAPSNNYESSILLELESGAYTVHLEKDSNETSGIGQIRIFSNSNFGTSS